jgi:3'-phosphoadenosine 5'-phosphosulfate sulfotransferase (PAPS reductase)/FAD synthetase
MSDFYRIDGPAVISFSGGRSSGYMLYHILQAHGGTLPDDVKVAFANTGKEMPPTLDFVRDCGERWDVPITWLEYRDQDEPQQRWQTVTYETAARKGEPFDAMLRRKAMLPNPVMRFCTIELKIKPAKFWAQQSLGWDHWTNILGYRADEPARVTSIHQPHKEPFDRDAPMAAAGVSKRDVAAFWRAQNFDLALPSVNGSTPLGNCDLCFLKSMETRIAIMRALPPLADWWIEKEATPRTGKASGARFRNDRPGYSALLEISQQPTLAFYDDHDVTDCFCGVGSE